MMKDTSSFGSWEAVLGFLFLDLGATAAGGDDGDSIKIWREL